MTAEADVSDVAPAKKKGMMLPLVLGLVLAGAGGGGGFFAVSSGMLGGGAGDHGEAAGTHAEPPLPPMGPVAFVPLDAMVVNLPPGSDQRYLSFTATLEVRPEAQAEVEAVKPRIVDVLNTYLRALEPSDLEDPTFLTRARGQLLRRVQLVTGEDRVRDILVIEFVLN